MCQQTPQTREQGREKEGGRDTRVKETQGTRFWGYLSSRQRDWNGTRQDRSSSVSSDRTGHPECQRPARGQQEEGLVS